ncbi:RRQRL motif-containing zinc-binding protein [Streptomyces sp. NPDC101209]|uniref:RRQRL motif-containing zinc-binding protein n=1 Tax=Streptomyces sp. NPDC101209 TaxID=3366129 RepID=UPI0038267515
MDQQLADDGRDLVDVDIYDDGSFPVFRWKQAPAGLATRRQLREMGLRPGGQEPAARIECRRGLRWAWLYRIDLAKPKRTPSLAQEIALDRAMAARQTCPRCRRRYYACLPLRTQGVCDPCHGGYEPSPDTVMSPAPTGHELAA